MGWGEDSGHQVSFLLELEVGSCRLGQAGLAWPGVGASGWVGAKANPLLPPPHHSLHMFQILCIDEATASVDQKTDQLLQQTICKRFANKTVLTIAHRCASVQSENLT